MTVEVGRKQINLGWETAWAIFAGIVVLSATIGYSFSTYMNAQASMQKDLATIARQVGQNTQAVAGFHKSIDSLKVISTKNPETTKPATAYYVEQKINGRIVLKPVNN